MYELDPDHFRNVANSLVDTLRPKVRALYALQGSVERTAVAYADWQGERHCWLSIAIPLGGGTPLVGGTTVLVSEMPLTAEQVIDATDLLREWVRSEFGC